MTIKELEARTGMSRANIRYYESEGLLAPKRLENGYRDYSEEDVATLEKIHLLRSLHLDIDAIRSVQRGELTLEQALFTLLTRLEGDRAALSRAAQVCRQLEESGAEYGALDPKPWLEQLAGGEQPSLAPPPPPEPSYQPRLREDPVDYAKFHPWLRFWARVVDSAIFSLPVNGVLMLAFHWNITQAGPIGQWFIELLSTIFGLLWEPVLLHTWGWTPGKWIFGLKLRDRDGEKLTLRAGYERVWGVFFFGKGCNIPIVDLVCAWRFWKRYQNLEDASWDEELEPQYIHEERRLSWAMFGGVAAARVVLTVLLALVCLFPPHRGGLTVADYYDNVNHYLNWKSTSTDRLDTDGTWLEKSIILNDNRPQFQVEAPDGVVTSVTLTQTATGIVYQQQYVYQMALLALAGAEKDVWPSSYDSWIALFDDQWDSFETEYQGIRITQTVECSDYDGLVSQVLWPKDGKTGNYSRVVTLELLDTP